MRNLFTVAIVCASFAAFAEPSVGGITEGHLFDTNDLPKLRKAYPFFDGFLQGIPEGDVRRTDEWEAHCYDISKRNEKGELVLLSKAEITRNRVEARPYLRAFGLNWFLSTLGQLTKQCDGVFIGVMSNVKGIDEEDKLKLKRGIGLTMEIEFQVETNLFGSVPSATVTIPVLWCDGEEQVPEKGVRVLVFYAQGYTIDVWNKAVRDFDWEKPPAKTDAPPAMLLEKLSSSVRVLKTAELEGTYIKTVDGYLRLLRREKRDPDKYYAYLRSLVKSPVWRIRQDAREDLLHLLGYYGPDRFDLQRALDDPELMEIFKDYIRYIAIPGREKRHAEAQKKQ